MPRPPRINPVARLANPKVMSTTGNRAAAGAAPASRSAIVPARIAVVAATELSGAPIANGSELPSASTSAISAETVKVMPRPWLREGASGPAKISSV